jgi:ubiquinone/menaquinone biosynthesis C-methylase UbiE
MNWWEIGLVAACLAVLVALVYWQMIIAEGAYLGARVVAWTYDIVSRRYDAIKQFKPKNESWFVAAPLLRELIGIERPLVLDVATGTGRLPLALLRERFRGQIVGLDLSRGMLRQARRKLAAYSDQVSLLWQDASRLPFSDGTFDAVTCLESLEFMPDPREALGEMVRVLAPGGVLFVTNRVGHEARLLPGRAIPRPEFERVLAGQPLSDYRVQRWQVNYDQAFARKAGERAVGARQGTDLASLLRCPACGGGVQRGGMAYSCQDCRASYPIREGMVLLAGHDDQGVS